MFLNFESLWENVSLSVDSCWALTSIHLLLNSPTPMAIQTDRTDQNWQVNKMVFFIILKNESSSWQQKPSEI